MTDNTETASINPDTNIGMKAVAKTPSPYRLFMWSGLVMAVLCFWLGTQRLGIKRPARADAYFITGILGILSAAMAWSLGAAHERARRNQQELKDSVDRLQDRMHDMPRALMEESVKVAEREAEGRRADQERQARELRAALEEGIRGGFAPLAPALSEKITASLGGLSEALRHDREERAASLRATGEAVASLRAAQAEWARSAEESLGKLRAQGEALQAGFSSREAEGRAALQSMAGEAARGMREALDAHLGKTEALTASLASKWDTSLSAQSETLRAFSGAQEASLQALAARTEALTGALAGKWDETLKEQATAVAELAAKAHSGLDAGVARAQEWLGGLSAATGQLGDALEILRRGGEESAASQAEWRATADMFHQGIGGVLDRLQSLGTFVEAQEALLRRMDETIRAFEERSAELIEDTALKAQESLLDALDQAGARDAALDEGAKV